VTEARKAVERRRATNHNLEIKSPGTKNQVTIVNTSMTKTPDPIKEQGRRAKNQRLQPKQVPLKASGTRGGINYDPQIKG
jgi:hypothetical protein